MEKTSLRLSKVIGLYLLAIAGLLVLVTIFFLMSFNKVSGVRADDVEKKVTKWIHVSEETQIFDIESFPEEADYVLENGSRVVTSKISNCTKEDMDRAISWLKANGTNSYLENQEVFILRTLKEDTIYIHYSLKVQGEWIAFISIIAAYILAILIPSVILIHKLRKIINMIAEEKWRDEYETKQEMAQIAHDLKTPLTVIRGNADLLLEKEQDEDSLDSINAIITNSERIARSILDILEKEN
ncbi:MAG: hypothetical protein K6G87_15180 [Butyrivibrio sp.]|uniref:histidine kinase dimerization/phospho-acceptor domain-containing protein n=1 Tax=Butyrivibrio sp. TaxID=28121 RepID=UPI0025D6A77C|nr:histidine kinase dimerization/phospho-acceptor domain-containing protein [Butyrivibrio sp.]MCR5772560.1 hypothetical protein [Butyrivibrio sp.]